MSAPPVGAEISVTKPPPPTCPYCRQPIGADRGLIANETVCGFCYRRLSCPRCNGRLSTCTYCMGAGIDPKRCPDADRGGCQNPDCYDCRERAEWAAEDSRDLRAKASGR